MLRFAKIIFFTLTLFFSAVFAFADWEKGDIDKIVEKINKGENFNEWDQYPDSQILHFETSRQISYIIDVKAKLCFVAIINTQGKAISTVSCKAIKKGYPLIAPVITWEK